MASVQVETPLQTVALRLSPREITIRRFRICVTQGPDSGSERESDGQEFSIGTAAANHLVLSDPTVSRHHLSITATAKGFLLRDLSSCNGTRLAGCRVHSAHLAPGAMLRLGATTLRFECLDDEIVEPVGLEEKYGRAIGRSAAMRRIFTVLPRVAASDSVVLLEGETGTGKSLLAEAIHQASGRARKPFIVLDCSAIPPTLIESELFGHEKGAFTGAHAARVGAFEAAQGGTVFLDEIGELPLDMQPKLLRALEERVIKRIGSVEPIKLDVRVIAATNRDLREMVNQSTFRSDLFFRLNVVRLRIPPLRERRDDVPLLARHFYAQLVGDEEARPPAELVNALLEHPLPGNVRELRAEVERAVLFEDPKLWEELNARPVVPTDAREKNEEVFDPSISFRAAKERARVRWERWWVTQLVKRHQGNLSAAARAAKMDRAHLRELLRRYGAYLHEE